MTVVQVSKGMRNSKHEIEGPQVDRFFIENVLPTVVAFCDPCQIRSGVDVCFREEKGR